MFRNKKVFLLSQNLDAKFLFFWLRVVPLFNWSDCPLFEPKLGLLKRPNFDQNCIFWKVQEFRIYWELKLWKKVKKQKSFCNGWNLDAEILICLTYERSTTRSQKIKILASKFSPIRKTFLFFNLFPKFQLSVNSKFLSLSKNTILAKIGPF